MTLAQRTVNGIVIEQRDRDGFINATAMCVAHGKKINDWFRSQSTIELIQALAAQMELKIKGGNSRNSSTEELSEFYPEIIITKRGAPENGGGTWIHPQLAVQLAQWCNPVFALAVSKWVLEWAKNKEESHLSYAPYYYRRKLEFDKRTGRIPSGYFCIFLEMDNLVRDLEKAGYRLPDDGLIDISIGKHWCKYLREERHIEPDDICRKYPHWYPGRSKPVDANIYPYDYLPLFRRWMEERYERYHLESYFKGRRDDKALKAVENFLCLPG